MTEQRIFAAPVRQVVAEDRFVVAGGIVLFLAQMQMPAQGFFDGISEKFAQMPGAHDLQGRRRRLQHRRRGK